MFYGNIDEAAKLIAELTTKTFARNLEFHELPPKAQEIRRWANPE
jgi:hypothetical protein